VLEKVSQRFAQRSGYSTPLVSTGGGCNLWELVAPT